MLNRTYCAAVAGLAAFALLAAGGVLFAEPNPQAKALLDKADELIGQGKAPEARTILLDVMKRFPTAMEAEHARVRIDRIKTIEVFIDYSHQLWGNSVPLGHFLYNEGFGVTWNKAYIPSGRKDLGRYELVVLWQDATDVPFDDLEYSVLLDYVRQGGHILIVTEPRSWRTNFPKKRFSVCPVYRLGKRFGLKMKESGETLDVGIGKAKHLINTGALSGNRLNSKDPTVRREVRSVIEQALPYQQLTRRSKSTEIVPEILFRHDPILFYYSQHLTKPAGWVKKALPAMTSYYKSMLGADLEHSVRIKGVAKKGEHIQATTSFDFNLYGSQPMVLHQLAVQLCHVWMIPKGKPLRYPFWVERGLPYVMALGALKKIRVVGPYQGYADYNRRSFRSADPDGTRMDVSVPPKKMPSTSYDGKSRFIFETLIKQFGPQFPSRFRKMVFLYARAGKLSDRLSTAETIRLLSLAAGKDLAPFFKSLGTQFTPLPPDFNEPGKLRKLLAEKET